MKDSKNVVKTGAVILGLLYVLPIILANRYYNDDVPQVLYLAPVWMKDGRPLTDILMRLLCGANNYIYDIFPLPLILAAIIMMIFSAKWTEMFYDTDNRILGIIVTFLPLSLGFFLANLSYRFDCIGYVMSFVLVMLPFMIKSTVTWKKYALNISCVLLAMCFYQATIGLYIALVIIMMFTRCVRNEKPFEDVPVCAISTVAAALLYKFVIAAIFVDKEGWRADAGRFSSVSAIPSMMIEKTWNIVLFIWVYLKSLGARQVVVYLLIILLGLISLYFVLEGRSSLNRALVLLFYCALPPAVFAVSVLPISMLDYDSAAPQHLPQLISLMFVLAIGLVLTGKRWPRLAIGLGILVVLFRFSFSYAYGNILRVQKEYAGYMAQSIADDIKALDDDSIDEIVIEGDMPYSPVSESLIASMPVLSKMVPSGIDKDGMFNGALINHYYPSRLNFIDMDDKAYDHIRTPGTPVSKNLVYDLYLENNRVYVRFR